MQASFFSAGQCARVYALVQGERKIHTQQREARRRCLDGGYWMSRGGAQWRCLPAE